MLLVSALMARLDLSTRDRRARCGSKELRGLREFLWTVVTAEMTPTRRLRGGGAGSVVLNGRDAVELVAADLVAVDLVAPDDMAPARAVDRPRERRMSRPHGVPVTRPGPHVLPLDLCRPGPGEGAGPAMDHHHQLSVATINLMMMLLVSRATAAKRCNFCCQNRATQQSAVRLRHGSPGVAFTAEPMTCIPLS